jgi:hypothetical protein
MERALADTFELALVTKKGFDPGGIAAEISLVG